MHKIDIINYNSYFFIGVAGAGMSAIAQYLSGIGKKVAGSDRYFMKDSKSDIRQKLENSGIKTYYQDGSGLDQSFDIVVVSTAVEEINPEYIKARQLHLEIIHRADLLAAITETKKTVAISGTSGKSTTVAMLFYILAYSGFEPSLITGAGLSNLIQEGKIGNAVAGKGEYLIIEADESDGSLIKYHPEIGIILNIDKDHKEITVLNEIFNQFKQNTKSRLIVNQGQNRAAEFSQNIDYDFAYKKECGFRASQFVQKSDMISFLINEQAFAMSVIGKHNMENALAAVACAAGIGVSLKKCAQALKNYQGIYRRMQIIGSKNKILVIDDYAHNPVKIAAAINACKPLSNKIIAWFQPHGFGPTRFLKDDFIKEISLALRDEDQIYMSEIYYAGGSVTKDISANDLIKGISDRGKNAFFVENRRNFPKMIQDTLAGNELILLMGARDPSLESFARFVFDEI